MVGSPSVNSGMTLLSQCGHVCPSNRCLNRQRSGEDVKAARKQVSFIKS